jgi:hypothetical protein
MLEPTSTMHNVRPHLSTLTSKRSLSRPTRNDGWYFYVTPAVLMISRIECRVSNMPILAGVDVDFPIRSFLLCIKVIKKMVNFYMFCVIVRQDVVT